MRYDGRRGGRLGTVRIDGGVNARIARCPRAVILVPGYGLKIRGLVRERGTPGELGSEA